MVRDQLPERGQCCALSCEDENLVSRLFALRSIAAMDALTHTWRRLSAPLCEPVVEEAEEIPMQEATVASLASGDSGTRRASTSRTPAS